jgi:hypothetical protein
MYMSSAQRIWTQYVAKPKDVGSAYLSNSYVHGLSVKLNLRILDLEES